MRKKRGVIRSSLRHLRHLRQRITYSAACTGFIAALTAALIFIYNKTLRIKFSIHPELQAIDRTKVCYGFWHGRQFLLLGNFRAWNACFMTDLSWAGEVQTRIAKWLGYVPVRGSSRRKGAQALLSIKKVMEEGYCGVFALDGPRGPAHKSKPGIVFLADKMGYPIVPVATSADRAWVLEGTWCRYLLPKPFSRCYVALGRPLWQGSLPDKLDAATLDRILIEWTAEADRQMGRTAEKERVSAHISPEL
jgi:lysophospholipid acyltransferase (LPLAT)-like uncharacterized protein